MKARTKTMVLRMTRLRLGGRLKTSAGSWNRRISSSRGLIWLVITASGLGRVAGRVASTWSGRGRATWWRRGHVTGNGTTRGCRSWRHLATGHSSSWWWMSSWSWFSSRLLLICQPLKVTFSCNLKMKETVTRSKSLLFINLEPVLPLLHQLLPSLWLSVCLQSSSVLLICCPTFLELLYKIKRNKINVK